jgi:tRNA(adenine34) deaminase
LDVTNSDQDIYFMRLALKEASLAFRMGEVPVGALLVKDGEVVSSSHNLRETLKDPSAHAEILALRDATKISDSWRLAGATLYVPRSRALCARGLLNARKPPGVWMQDEKAGVDSLYRILNDERLNHQVKLFRSARGGCAGILRTFFRERR